MAQYRYGQGTSSGQYTYQATSYQSLQAASGAGSTAQPALTYAYQTPTSAQAYAPGATVVYTTNPDGTLTQQPLSSTTTARAGTVAYVYQQPAAQPGTTYVAADKYVAAQEEPKYVYATSTDPVGTGATTYTYAYPQASSGAVYVTGGGTGYVAGQAYAATPSTAVTAYGRTTGAKGTVYDSATVYSTGAVMSSNPYIGGSNMPSSGFSSGRDDRARDDRRRERELERERDRERDRQRRQRERELERERERERHREKEKELVKAREDAKGAKESKTGKKEDTGPPKEPPPFRRYYLCKIEPHLFCEPVRGYHAVARRYPRLYMPSDFTHSVISWAAPAFSSKGALPHLPLKFPITFEHNVLPHAAGEEDPAPAPTGPVLIPAKKTPAGPGSSAASAPFLNDDFAHAAGAYADLPTQWVVKVVPMTGVDEAFWNELLSDKNPQERPPHLHNGLKFVVWREDRNPIAALGGPIDPGQDGNGDPAKEDSVLQHAGARLMKALAGVDISGCTKWTRFLEVHYMRVDSELKPTHREAVVYLLPDLSTCLPAQAAWEAAWLALYEARKEQEEKEKKERDEKEKAEKDEAEKEKAEKAAKEEGKTKEEKGDDKKGATKGEEEKEAAAEKAKNEKKAEEAGKAAEEGPVVVPPPGFIFRRKPTKKTTKVKTLSISLDGLLDYDEDDRDENSFELALFAESFADLLQERAGRLIAQELESVQSRHVARKRKEEEERKAKKDEEKKRKTEAEEEEEKEKNKKKAKEDGAEGKEEPADKANALGEAKAEAKENGVGEKAEVVEESSAKAGEKEERGDEERAEVKAEESQEKTPTRGKGGRAARGGKAKGRARGKGRGRGKGKEEAEEEEEEAAAAAEEVKQEEGGTDVVMVEADRDARKEASADAGDGKEEATAVDEKPEEANEEQVLAGPVIIHPEVLQAFRYFDRNRVNFLKIDDLRRLLHCISSELSHKLAKELSLVAVLESGGKARDERVFYRELTGAFREKEKETERAKGSDKDKEEAAKQKA